MASGLQELADRLELDRDEIERFRAVETHVALYGAASAGCIFVLTDGAPDTFTIVVVIPGGPAAQRAAAVVGVLLAAADLALPEDFADSVLAPIAEGFCRAVVLSDRRLIVQDLRHLGEVN